MRQRTSPPISGLILLLALPIGFFGGELYKHHRDNKAPTTIQIQKENIKSSKLEIECNTGKDNKKSNISDKNNTYLGPTNNNANHNNSYNGN